MTPSRAVAGHIVSFLSDVRERGSEAALKSRDLGELVGKPIVDVFLGLADLVCPRSGSVDDSIARDAFIKCVVDVSKEAPVDLDQMSADQMDRVLERFVAHSIEDKIYNDIGNRSIQLPKGVAESTGIQRQLNAHIRNCVSDAIGAMRQAGQTITNAVISTFVDSIYVQAFTFIRVLGETLSS